MGYTGQQFKSAEQLASVLRVSLPDLIWCTNHMHKLVHPVPVTKSDGKPRNVLGPDKQLKIIKATFFSRYEFAPYVYGLGGNSLRDHALVHKGAKCLVKLDVRNFFPSIGYARVTDMWESAFGLPQSLARILTKLTTYHGSLQQGFPTSSHIAAIIAEPMGKDIDEYCVSHKLKFSQYVDDINISGATIDKADAFRILIPIAHRHNFPIKRRKTTIYENDANKLITGVVLANNATRATRKVRRKAFYALQDYKANPKSILAQRRVAGYARFIGGLRKADGKALRKRANRGKL